MHCFVCRLLYFSNFGSARILLWYTNSSSSSSSNLFLISLCKIALINWFYSYIYCTVFRFHCQLNFVLQDCTVRADRSTFLLSVQQPCKKLECVWWEELLRYLFQETEKASTCVTCLSSSAWAEQDSSSRAGCANHSGNLVASAPCSCLMRQSWLVCTLVLQWAQETICWCCPFPVWEYGLYSIPAPSRQGK